MADAVPQIVEGLDVNEVKDGLVVYDERSDRVHYLNATAAVVFTLVDGQRDATAIAGLVGEAFTLDDPPLGEVEQCLADLEREGLLA